MPDEPRVLYLLAHQDKSTFVSSQEILDGIKKDFFKNYFQQKTSLLNFFNFVLTNHSDF